MSDRPETRGKWNAKLALGIAVGSAVGSAIAVIGMSGANHYGSLADTYVDSFNELVSMRKMDGVTGHTQIVQRDSGEVEVRRFKLTGIVTITDAEGDGRADSYSTFRGILDRGPEYLLYTRDEHLEDHPAIFEEADRILAEQMARFEPTLDSLLNRD